MGLRLGLGDSTDNTVQDSEVLQEDHRTRDGVHFMFPDKKNNKSSAHLTGLFQTWNTSSVFGPSNTGLS